MNGHLRSFSQLAAVAAAAEVRHHHRLLLPLHPPLRVPPLLPPPLPRILLRHTLPPPVRLRVVAVGDDEVVGGCVFVR